MNWKKQEEHVKTIARYFEVHENELWSEILPILSQSHQQGRMEREQEIIQKIEDYFTGLVHVAVPRLTKEKLISTIINPTHN